MTWLITGGAGYIGAHVVRAMIDGGGTDGRVRRPVHRGRRTGARGRAAGGRLDPGRRAAGAHPRRTTGSPASSISRRRSRSASRSSSRCTTTGRTSRACALLLDGGDRGGVRVLRVLLLGRGVRHAATWTWSRRRRPALPMSPVRRDQAGRRVAGPGDGPGDRPVDRLPALLQRGGRGEPRARRHRCLQPRPHGLREAHRGRARRGSSATTTRPRTGPASATTSTSSTWPRPMSRPPGALRAAPGRDLTLNIGRGRGRLGARDDRPHQRAHRLRPDRPRSRPRRPGDPARVVASADRIATELGWKARHDVQDMITSAWEGWVRQHPEARRG